MIYIIFGLSGPLKRLLIDPIYDNYDLETAKRMVNVRAIARQKEEYDGPEIITRTEKEIRRKYEPRYMYNLRKDTLCAVDKEQIDESIKSNCDHFIVCHDFEVIKNIIADYGNDQVRVFNISFNHQLAFVRFCEKRYNGNSPLPLEERVEKRLKKLAINLDSQLTDGNLGIEPDEMRLTYPDNEDDICNLLWEKLKRILDANKYNWQMLLNPGRLSGKSSMDSEAFIIQFQNDYDLIINSSPFRRLQDKAQVFPLEKYDYVRTRLTHSIECAIVSEKLGILAESIIQKKLKPDYNRVPHLKAIPTIVKCAALLHDIGNPPFGHFGEDVIRNWIKNRLPFLGIYENKIKDIDEEKQRSLKHILGETSEYYCDLLNYEGNAQGLRIITHLCVSADNWGYDLTYAILGTILKYPTSSCEIKKDISIERKKVGYFAPEKIIYQKVKKELGLKEGKRHPLTYLLEAADDISYLSSDMQDAHKKRLISLPMMCDELVRMSCMDTMEDSGIKPEVAQETAALILNKIWVFEREFEQFNVGRDSYVIEKLHHFIKDELIRRAIDVFDKNYDGIMEAKYKGELLSGDQVAKFICLFIRRLLEQHVYNDMSIVKTAVKATAIIDLLLDTFVPACIERALYEKKLATGTPKELNDLEPFEKSNVASSRIYRLLSDNYRYVFEKSIRDENGKIRSDSDIVYNAILLALDNICGMTDSYAEEMYKMLLACT